MEDKRLEKRKEFFDPVKDGRIEREKYMVELRKKRKQDIFKKKRRIITMEESKDGKTNSHNPNCFALFYRFRFLLAIVGSNSSNCSLNNFALFSNTRLHVRRRQSHHWKKEWASFDKIHEKS